MFEGPLEQKKKETDKTATGLLLVRLLRTSNVDNSSCFLWKPLLRVFLKCDLKEFFINLLFILTKKAFENWKVFEGKAKLGEGTVLSFFVFFLTSDVWYFYGSFFGGEFNHGGFMKNEQPFVFWVCLNLWFLKTFEKSDNKWPIFARNTLSFRTTGTRSNKVLISFFFFCWLVKGLISFIHSKVHDYCSWWALFFPSQ